MTHQQSAGRLAGARFVVALADAHLGQVDRGARVRGRRRELAAQGRQPGLPRAQRMGARPPRAVAGQLTTRPRCDCATCPSIVDAMGYRNPGVRPVHADAIEARIAVGEHCGRRGDDRRPGRAGGRRSITHRSSALAERCRGLLAAAAWRPEAGIAYTSSAPWPSSSDRPSRCERGRTLLAMGATMRRAKRRREAREALGQALEIFDLLGAPLWAERAAGELARIPGRIASTGELSETERRVAELVAEGSRTRRSRRACSCRCGRSRRTCRASTPSWGSDRAASWPVA